MNRAELRRLFIDRQVNARTLTACVAAKYQRGAVISATDNFGAMTAALWTDWRMGLCGGVRRVIVDHNVI